MIPKTRDLTSNPIQMINNFVKDKLLLEMPIVSVKTKIGVKLIRTSDILFVEADKKNSKIVFQDNQIIETIHPIKWFNNLFLEPIFFRSHNSFLVNCLYFRSICGSQIILTNDNKTMIPVSRTKRNEVIRNIIDLYKLSALPDNYFQLEEQLVICN